jgi:hypothetical protein
MDPHLGLMAAMRAIRSKTSERPIGEDGTSDIPESLKATLSRSSWAY